jgi:hypothetical protein
MKDLAYGKEATDEVVNPRSSTPWRKQNSLNRKLLCESRAPSG